jgi:hypothetical protein
VGVQRHGAVLGYGTNLEFRSARRPKLAYRQQVERGPEPLRHLETDRHAAGRERDHDRMLARERRQLLGEPAPSIATIEKRHALIVARLGATVIRSHPHNPMGDLPHCVVSP